MTGGAGETLDVAGLLDLWTKHAGSDADAVAAFRAYYADPVLVNGTALSTADLAERAAVIRGAFDDLTGEVLDVAVADSRVTVVFRLTGRQTGPFPTAAGTLRPTGHQLSIRIIDLLTVEDGLITQVWMTADELGALAAADLVALPD